jgi:uncharacterized protein (DUF1697 family)
MEKAGYTHVKTLLASGNVVFETSEKDVAKITSDLEELYKQAFGFEIPVILQTGEEIASLIRQDPFKDIVVTKDTRRYITFRSDQESHKKQSTLKIPYVSSDNTFRILSVTENEICSVLVLTPGSKTLQLMDILEKEYGKHVTTRNWNTIEVLKTWPFSLA